jgi:hypothetical protein
VVFDQAANTTKGDLKEGLLTRLAMAQSNRMRRVRKTAKLYVCRATRNFRRDVRTIGTEEVKCLQAGVAKECC